MHFLFLGLTQITAQKRGKTQNIQDITLIADTAHARVSVYCGPNLFTVFRYSDTLEKPVLFPVVDAFGQKITRGFPFENVPGERTDHPHQVGIWFNYGDVNGLDFWNNSYAVPGNEKFRYGRIVAEGHPVISAEKGKWSGFTYYAVWRSETGHDLLKEITTYSFQALDSLRIIQRRTILMALRDKVVFTDNKEGLFAIRVARFLELPSKEPAFLTDSHGNITTVPVSDNTGVTGNYISSSGKIGDAVWGTRNNWVTLTGENKGNKVSVTLFDHSSNPGYPAHFHARGYGLFAVNNLGQQLFNVNEPKQTFVLMPGEKMTFHHMIVISSGKWLTKEEANALFSDFCRAKE